MEIYIEKAVFALIFLMYLSGIILISTSYKSWSLKRRLILRYSKEFRCSNKGDILLKKIRQNKLLLKIKCILESNRERKSDQEIFEAVIYLRNLAAIEDGNYCSSDLVIERLSEKEGFLKPVFIHLLSLLRANRPDEAINYFSEKSRAKTGREFVKILINWDNIKASELIESLTSYENAIRTERITRQKKKDELISELIYFPVVVNIIIIFINFIYVSYFIDQQEMIKMFI